MTSSAAVRASSTWRPRLLLPLTAALPRSAAAADDVIQTRVARPRRRISRSPLSRSREMPAYRRSSESGGTVTREIPKSLHFTCVRPDRDGPQRHVWTRREAYLDDTCVRPRYVKSRFLAADQPIRPGSAYPTALVSSGQTIQFRRDNDIPGRDSPETGYWSRSLENNASTVHAS